jgi:hypothetical protein
MKRKAHPAAPVVPPTVKAIVRLGGSTAAAAKLDVSLGVVKTWMRSRSVPMAHVRRLAKLSGVSLEEFFKYEEGRKRA